MTDPLQFLVASFLLLAVPGPTNAVMAVAGASNRTGPPWLFVAAMLAGYAAIIAAARLVLLPAIAAWPALGMALRLAVVAYLLYAAWRLWRGRAPGRDSRDVGPALVFSTTALNPKGLVFAISIIPAAHPALWSYLLAFAVLTLAVGLAWFFAGRLIASWSGRHADLIPRAGALVLTGFAAWIAATLAG